MITVDEHFDGERFAKKFDLNPFGDFEVLASGELYCPSLPNLTEADIADCLITPDNYAAMDRIAARKASARAEARLATQFKTLTPQQATSYIENNVTNLATAKDVLKIMARILIAMRDEIWPDLPED